MRMSIDTNTNMKVTIDPVEQEKIWWYVDKCDKEISGLGRVVKVEDGHYHVTKIYLLKQECSAVETELDDEAVAALLFESRDDEGEMLFWWHSHVNMGTGWSGTDHDTMKQLGKSGMIISSVFNKKREHRTSIYLAPKDYHPHVYIDDLVISTAVGLLDEEEVQLEKEYAEKVTFPVANAIGFTDNYYGGYDAWGGSTDRGVPATPNYNKILREKYDKMLKGDKGQFLDAYRAWHGNDSPDWKSAKEREAYYTFCNYYNFDTEELADDWGYSASNTSLYDHRGSLL